MPEQDAPDKAWWTSRTALAILAVGAVAAVVTTQFLQPKGLPAYIASGNGRLEATEFDVAPRSGGRVLNVLVKEGEDVKAGQVLATMDTQSLDADWRRAQAQVMQARNARDTVQALLAQREQSVQTAQAVVSQRQAEQALATKQWQRTRELVNKGFLAPQKLDEASAQLQSVKAALSAAMSQVAEAKAAVLATQSQKVEAESAIESAAAALARVDADRADSNLKAPKDGRVQVISARAGEVLGGGGRVLSLVDIKDVYMTFFLPETAAGRVALGSEARLVLDAAPQFVVPAKVSYVASVAQFTPKTVETTAERQKMVFKVRAQVDPALLERYRAQVKTGMPGMAYVNTASQQPWPAKLAIALPAQP